MPDKKPDPKAPDPKAPKGYPHDSGFSNTEGPIPAEHFENDLSPGPLAPGSQALVDWYDKEHPDKKK
jgi:hypothetical protein